MRIIHVKQIGAIVDSGEITISPVTVFCGQQGSGKSTLAKLISTCLWIEKALVKGEITEKYATGYNHFRKQLCGYHGIDGFFRADSYLLYKSNRFTLKYEEQHFYVEERAEEAFPMPKIMYVPAERNLLVAIEHAERIRKLPASLLSLQSEYINALQAIKGQMQLPIDGVAVQYDRLNKVTWFNGMNFRVPAQHAASGFQSVAPLSLVTEHLSRIVEEGNGGPLSSAEMEKLRQEVTRIQTNGKLSEEVKNIMIENVNKRYVLDCFLNIVEEPEQNLYPTTQRNVLNLLLANLNRHKGNMLVITTHSPYILDYLCINVKAFQVSQKVAGRADDIARIVPQGSWVDPNQVAIYEIQDDGSVEKLQVYDGVPSDNNFLNNALAETNMLFGELMDIEENGES